MSHKRNTILKRSRSNKKYLECNKKQEVGYGLGEKRTKTMHAPKRRNPPFKVNAHKVWLKFALMQFCIITPFDIIRLYLFFYILLSVLSIIYFSWYWVHAAHILKSFLKMMEVLIVQLFYRQLIQDQLTLAWVHCLRMS